MAAIPSSARPTYTHIRQTPLSHQVEALTHLATLYRSAMPLGALLVAVFIWSLWSYMDHTQKFLILLAWIAAIPMGMGLSLRRFLAGPVDPADAPYWGSRFTIFSTLEGCCIGLVGFLLYDNESAAPQMIFAAISLARLFGLIAMTVNWPAVFYGNAYCSLVPTAIGILLRDFSNLAGVTVSLLIYMGIAHVAMHKYHEITVQALAMKYEREDMIKEISQGKELAEQANRAKSRFLAAASHDLRQPLHAMTLFVAAMKTRAQGSVLTPMVEQIQRCTSALESLLQTLLDISKIDAGTVVPQACNFHLQPILERLRDEHALQARSAGLALSVDCPPLTLHSDPALLEAILRNLISNAIRYTGVGSVVIQAYAKGAAAVVAVRDSGIGIPPDKQAEIFQEFVQLDNPERDRIKGLGLGLAIVQRLARLLDSRIDVESELGTGSTFSIALPVGDANAVLPQTKDAPVSNLLEGCVVAFVDDESDICQGMQLLLGDWGCKVFAAEDAAGVIRLLDAEALSPDIIVTDYRLRNHTTGLDAMRSLHERFGPVPGAIITGDTASEHLEEVRASGFPMLHKPVQPAKLRTLLSNLRRSHPSGSRH